MASRLPAARAGDSEQPVMWLLRVGTRSPGTTTASRAGSPPVSAASGTPCQGPSPAASLNETAGTVRTRSYGYAVRTAPAAVLNCSGVRAPKPEPRHRG